MVHIWMHLGLSNSGRLHAVSVVPEKWTDFQHSRRSSSDRWSCPSAVPTGEFRGLVVPISYS